MAISPHDDVFSVDEDFEDTNMEVLHPSLTPTATAVATKGQKKKGTPAVAAAAAQRGRAWRERDSILLVKAYEWTEETRKGTTFFIHSVLIKGNELQPIQDNNMYKYWLSLDPNETGRTSTSVIARWKQSW